METLPAILNSTRLTTSTYVVFTSQTMKHIRPKLSKLFYGSGPKKTIPDCTIKVVPWYHSEAVFHQYSESKSASCGTPSLQMLPFFIDNFGPNYTEWTTTAHEQLPGHHLEVRWVGRLINGSFSLNKVRKLVKQLK